MSDLDDGLVTDTAPDTDYPPAAAPPAAGSADSPSAALVATVEDFDASALVQSVHTDEVAKEVRKIVAEALEQALTPERREQLAVSTAAAVEAELRAMTGESAGSASDPAEEVVENHFPNVYVFVQDFLVRVAAHPVREQQSSWRWCSRWWEHPEAVSRLEALWKAFEVLRRDPGTGASTWWRDHADPTMTALTSSDGTFAKCSDTTHTVPPDLPMEEPSDWLLKSDGS